MKGPQMTIKAINERLEVETVVHETARQCVELIQAATKRVKELGGDPGDAQERITELVTAD
jgi:hypothetical protein